MWSRVASVVALIVLLAGCAMSTAERHYDQAVHDKAVALVIWDQIEQRHRAGQMREDEWRTAQEAYRRLAMAQDAYVNAAREGRDTSQARAEQQRALQALVAVARSHGVVMEGR